MSLLQLLNTETGDAEQTEFLSKAPPLNLFAGLAHAPAAARATALLGGAILYDGKLDPRAREMAILRVGHLAGCDYEIAQHEAIGRDVGLCDHDFAAAATGDATGLGEEARLALLWAEEAAATGSASPDLVERTIRQLGARCAVELAVIVGYYRMLAIFLKSFEIPIETESSGRIRISERPEQLDQARKTR